MHKLFSIKLYLKIFRDVLLSKVRQFLRFRWLYIFFFIIKHTSDIFSPKAGIYRVFLLWISIRYFDMKKQECFIKNVCRFVNNWSCLFRMSFVRGKKIWKPITCFVQEVNNEKLLPLLKRFEGQSSRIAQIYACICKHIWIYCWPFLSILSSSFPLLTQVLLVTLQIPTYYIYFICCHVMCSNGSVILFWPYRISNLENVLYRLSWTIEHEVLGELDSLDMQRCG